MVSGTTYDYSKLGAFYAKVWNKDSLSAQFGYTKVDRFTHAEGSKHTYWSTVDGNGNLVEYFWKKNATGPETKYFYAYTNLPATGATVTSTAWNAQELQYTVPASEADQKDILLGLGSGQGYTKTGYVGRFAQIAFGHPLVAVRFRKGTIEDWTETDKITNIRITGAYSTGKYTNAVSGSSWSNCSGSTTVSMGDTTGTFFLIPQNLSTQSITIKADITVDGTSYTDITGTLDTGLWEAGKYYTYTLSFSPSQSFILNVSIADWGRIEEEVELEAGSVLGLDDPALNPWNPQSDAHIPYSD